MASIAERISKQRDIIDRSALAEKIEGVVRENGAQARRPHVLEILQSALAEGRAEIKRRLGEHPSQGYHASAEQAFLIDQIVRLIYDYVTVHAYPAANRTASERIAVLAVGGYGSGEMAPHSDVDIAFVTPYKRSSWTEQVVEAILYLLWDLGLKVGQ